MAGQLRDDRCDVWDLPTGLYRGDIAADDCRRWEPPAPQVPAALASGTPAVPGAARPPPVVSARDRDGRRVATGRQGGAEVKVWNATPLALAHTVALPSGEGGDESDEPPQLAGLAWTPRGELVLAGHPFGAALWSPDTPQAPARSLGGESLRITSLSLDPAGRYLGYTAEYVRERGEGLRRVAVRSLADGAWLLDGNGRPAESETETDDVAPLRPHGWSPSGDVTYALRSEARRDGPCREPSLQLATFDVRRARVGGVWVARGEHVLLAASPDGAHALWATIDAGACPPPSSAPPAPTPAPAPTIRMLSWAAPPAAQAVAWSAPERAEHAAWAPDSSRLAVAAASRVHVYEPSSPRPRASFAGGAPLAWSSRGDRLAFAGPRGALEVRTSAGAPVPHLPAADVRAAAWGPDDTLAVADGGRVTVIAVAPGAPPRTIARAGVRAMEFDATGARLLLVAGDGEVQVEEAGALGAVTRASAEATATWAAGGDVAVVERTSVRTFRRGPAGWGEHAASAVAEGEKADPTGRLTASVVGEVARVRRLKDGEVFAFDGERAWTGRYAYDDTTPRHPRAPWTSRPEDVRASWVFRAGDVLAGAVARGAEAPFVTRVPGLGEAFVTGAVLPGLLGGDRGGELARRPVEVPPAARRRGANADGRRDRARRALRRRHRRALLRDHRRDTRPKAPADGG